MDELVLRASRVNLRALERLSRQTACGAPTRNQPVIRLDRDLELEEMSLVTQVLTPPASETADVPRLSR